MKNISRSFFALLAVVLIVSACKKNKVTPALGVWVESKNKADTLVFMIDNMLDLRRGKELNGAHLLPKIGSGLYFYEFKKDSIKLQYSLSSTIVNKYYAFKILGSKLYIGDFYNKNTPQGQELIFEQQ